MSIQALQQTGHANGGSARHDGFPRVSRLLSLLFGEGGQRRCPEIVRFVDW
jgi:hypothetical protein